MANFGQNQFSGCRENSTSGLWTVCLKMHRQPDLAVPLPPSIHTPSLVQIGPVVWEICELPFFIAARLGTVRLKMIGNPT